MSDLPRRRETARRLLASATLVCGAEMDSLLEQVADGHAAPTSEHQRDCAYCQAALEQLALMWAPIAEMTTTPVPTPPALAAAVARRLQTAVRDVWCLSATELGAVHITARAITAVACDAARRVSGVRSVFGRSTRTGDALQTDVQSRLHQHTSGEPDAAVAVDLAVAVGFSECAGRVARDVRQGVIAALQDHLGLRAIAVNVAVDQVASS